METTIIGYIGFRAYIGMLENTSGNYHNGVM